MLAMSIVVLPYVARIVYIDTVNLRESAFVEAARISGVDTLRIILGEILPNVLSPVIVYGTTSLGALVVFAAGLSFLGGRGPAAHRGLGHHGVGRTRGPDLGALGLAHPRNRHRRRRRRAQLHQNPHSALHPMIRIGRPLRETVALRGRLPPERARDESIELLELVGLSARHAEYYPHEFSGGQCQRLGIARAIASNPSFIFLDEPVSALDVSIQAQILNLLKEPQEELHLSYLVAANNLNVARFVSDRLAIMEAGRIEVLRPTEDIFAAPEQACTRELLGAILSLDAYEEGGEREVESDAGPSEDPEAV